MAMRGGSHALRMNGDWLCPRCGDLQFARNVQCRICGAGRPPFCGPGGMTGYEDVGYGAPGYGAPGGVNGYPGVQYPGSLPYTDGVMYPFGAYPPGPNGKGGHGRLPRGRRFPGNGSFNGGFNGGFNGHSGGYAGGPNGKGLRGPPTSSSMAPSASQDKGTNGASGPEGTQDASASPTGENGAASALSAPTLEEEPSGGAEEVVVESLECPHHLAGAVIGRHGSAIAQLRRETRCHIEIEASPGNGAPRAVTVCGPRGAVQDAVNRIRDTLNERLANAEQNGEGPFGSGRAASDEDRQRTSRLIDQLEAKDVLRRAWLDERCMEVLMMLPFDVTSRVLHEAERVDLWKTRNVSAFLMMLVKTVQQTPDRRDNNGDRMPFRGNHRNMQPRPHGMRNDGGHWMPQQGSYHAMYGPPHGQYMAVLPVAGAYPQGFPGFNMNQEYSGGLNQYQMGYDPNYISGYQQGANVAQGAMMAAPPSPSHSAYAAPFAVVGGGWDPSGSPQGGGGNIAVPMSPAGVPYEYSPTMAPQVVMVPASPQHVSQVQQSDSVIFEQLPPPSHKYAGDGTQTPEIGSDPGEGLHESLLSIYPADVA